MKQGLSRPLSVLSRVQAFLPQIEASNALLTQRMQEDPASVDIEHISEGSQQYIEMVHFRISQDKTSPYSTHCRTLASECSKTGLERWIMTSRVAVKTLRCLLPRRILLLVSQGVECGGRTRRTTRTTIRMSRLRSSPVSYLRGLSAPFQGALRTSLVLILLSWRRTLEFPAYSTVSCYLRYKYASYTLCSASLSLRIRGCQFFFALDILSKYLSSCTITAYRTAAPAPMFKNPKIKIICSLSVVLPAQ